MSRVVVVVAAAVAVTACSAGSEPTNNATKLPGELRSTWVRGTNPGQLGRTPEQRAQHEAERRASEIENEQKSWRAELRRDCLSARKRPAICVELLNRGRFSLGQKIAYRVTWRNLARASGLVVRLENAAPAGERWAYAAGGPLFLSPVPLTGSGSKTFTWDGESIGCAPGDLPTYCKGGIQPGLYRIRATLFDRADFRLLGWPDNKPKEPIAQGETGEFAIAGTTDLAPLIRSDELRLTRFLVDHGFFVPFYSRKLTERRLPLQEGRLTSCAELTLLAPLRGTINACVPNDTIDRYGLKAAPEDLTYSGTVSFLPGLIPINKAEIAAKRAALASIKDRPRYIGYPTDDPLVLRTGGRETPPWLEIYVEEGGFEPADGGAWVFRIRFSTHEGYEHVTHSQTFKVRVGSDGSIRTIEEQLPGLVRHRRSRRLSRDEGD